MEPPLMGQAPPLQCNRLMSGDHQYATIDPPSGLPHCGQPATWHIMWTADLDNGLACVEHMEEARRKWTYYAAHPYEPTCSMPGAFFVDELNQCFADDGDLLLYAQSQLERADA